MVPWSDLAAEMAVWAAVATLLIGSTWFLGQIAEKSGFKGR